MMAKGVLLSSLLSLIFTPEISQVVLANAKSSSIDFEKVGELISFNLEKHYRPKTLRLIYGNAATNNVEPFYNYKNWELLHQLGPILLIPIQLSPQIRVKFFTSTVVYFLLDKESKKFTMAHLQAETANRRWDRVILVGKNDAFFQEPKLLQLLTLYRTKMGISLDTNTIWVEPKLFDKNNLMVRKTLNILVEDKKSTIMATNIRQRHFRISGCEFPPWTLKIREKGKKDRVWGTHYEIIAFAAKTFNFTFESNVLDGPNYGELHPNGTWSGMYAMIYYRERGYDWCYMLGHDSSWSAYVDYASTFGTIDLIFATAWPVRELKWSAVFEPLEFSVWSWTVISFVFVSIVFYIFKKVHAYIDNELKKKSSTNDNDATKSLSLVESFLTSYCIILEQGVDNVDGIKLIVALWLIFTIIVGTGYKGTLKSRLTFFNPEILPSDYKQLAERNDFEIILNAQGVVEKMFFSTTTIPEMINIRGRMKKEFFTEVCVAEAFLKRHHACIGWYPYFKQTVSATLTLFSGLEPLIYTKQAAHFNSLSMAFQKDSIFVDAFTPITAALYETGLYFVWEQNVNNYYKEIGRTKVLENKNSEVYEKLVFYQNWENM